MTEGFRLSPTQQRVWSRQHSGEAFLYQAQVDIEGDLKVPKLSNALTAVVNTHEILRTGFQFKGPGKTGLQFIREKAPILLRRVDLQGISDAEWKVSFRRIAEEDARAIERPGDWAVSLARLGPERHRLFLTLPALCADQYTIEALLRQTAAAYQSGEDHPQAGEFLQYADVAESLNQLLESPESAAGRDYWKNQSWIPIAARNLPIERRLAAQSPFTSESHSVRFPSDLIEAFDLWSRRTGIPLRACLHSCFQILLWRLLDCSEFVIGAVFEGRHHDELRQVLGPLERVLPVVCSPDRKFSFRRLAEDSAKILNEHSIQQDCFIGPEPDLASSSEGRLPFVFEFHSRLYPFSAGGLVWNLLSSEGCVEPYRLRCSCRPEQTGLRVDFHYDATLIDSREILIFAGQFIDLARAVMEDPESPLGEISFSDDQAFSNGSDVKHTDDFLTVAELFVRQAEETPDLTAVVAPDGARTYAELLDEAVCISAQLRQCGVGPDTPVALLVERSVSTLSALWGILLSGGAYLPLEPGSPPAYLTRQLAESRVSVLLASQRMRDHLPAYGGKLLCLDDLLKNRAPSAAYDLTAVRPEHLAYVIATSGSTGAPKAVGVLQGGLCNYTLALADRLQLRRQESGRQLNFAIVSTLAADLGNTCLFPALTTGACLHLVSSDLALDGQAFAEYMTRNRIDVLKIVPSHLRALLGEGQDALPQRWLIVGGEIFPADLLDRIEAVGARCDVINHYGPTETTVGALMERLDRGEDILLPPALPVGLPLPNTEAYVLDESMRPVPTNMVGELYLGGAGLARGYLFRPNLTAERFLPNPLSSQPGQRLYRTGDRARRRRDGRIQVLGRADSQVKIRGHRIELEEIESVLRHHPAVEAAAVMICEDRPDSRRLVAFLSNKPAFAHDPADLRRFLADELPPAMIPFDFIRLPALPLTPNGKLDRKKLAAIGAEEREPSDAPQSPCTALETTIANIWAESLGCRPTQMTQNFFELGGDSIIAIQVAAKLRKEGLSITPLQLFQHPTVAGLASALSPAGRGAPLLSTATEPAEDLINRDEPYSLSPLQQGMLFHALNKPGDRLYVSELVCVFGEGFDPDAFAQAWQRVVDRHSIFRTAFSWEDGPEPQQIAYPRVAVNIERFDWSDAESSESLLLQHYCEGAHRAGIDLKTPPLMKLALMRLSRGRYQFVWIYHHLLMDGWSETILNDELSAYYQAFRSGKECVRPTPAPYRAYINWLNLQDQSKAERFWRNYLRGFRKPTLMMGTIEEGLPWTGPATWGLTQLSVPVSESELLREFARARKLTLNTLVQAAWALVVGEYTGTDEVVFGATVAGRPVGLPGADLTIGPFLNTLPVRVRLPRETAIFEWLAQLQQEQAEAREYEHAPLVQVQAWGETPRGSALFDNFIGFQNTSPARSEADERRPSAPIFPIEKRSFRGGWTNYPLSLDVEPGPEILFTLSFDRERVTSMAAGQILACLKFALSLIASAPTGALLALLRESLVVMRREQFHQQEKGVVEAQRSQLHSLRRRG